DQTHGASHCKRRSRTTSRHRSPIGRLCSREFTPGVPMCGAPPRSRRERDELLGHRRSERQDTSAERTGVVRPQGEGNARSALTLLLVELGQVEVLELLEVLGGEAARGVGRGLRVALAVFPAGAGAELLRAVLRSFEQSHLGLELGEGVVLAADAALLE